MKTKDGLKLEHSDLTRQMEADVREEQRVRAELQEKQSKLQQQADSDARMADALLRPILARREEQNRKRTKLEAQIELLEEQEKEAAKDTPPKEQNT